MNVAPIAIYSEADVQSLHVSQAAQAICVGPASAAQSYLDVSAVLNAARQSGAQAIHPGYGFLSENADFAEACEAAGLAFIGPTPQQMRQFGLKHTARDLAKAAGVPLLPGTGILTDVEDAIAQAATIRYPVMLKSTAGGGGIGMRLCRNESELLDAFDAVTRLSQSNFKQGGLFLEKFVERARHIEVQIFGDGAGGVIDWGERDCSVQRRNQKVIEETPAPGLAANVREELRAAAVALAKTVNYRSAGTVEFVYDSDAQRAYFLEVNTRLQVEHGVTEEVTGLDLVACMVRLAAHELPALETLKRTPRGHSLQVRVYAEDPAKNFQPSAGLLTEVRLPQHARCETWVETGTEVTSYYDPLLAKIIVHGDSREHSIALMQAALSEASFAGLESNLDYLRFIAEQPEFAAGGVTTKYLSTLEYQTRALQIVEPGTMTTVQDYPGRTGYWNVGVPPSGPMDSVAFRAANTLLGNPASAAALECTLSGPSIRFTSGTAIAITGAAMHADIDGVAVPHWTRVPVAAGSLLRMGSIDGSGTRSISRSKAASRFPRTSTAKALSRLAGLAVMAVARCAPATYSTPGRHDEQKRNLRSPHRFTQRTGASASSTVRTVRPIFSRPQISTRSSRRAWRVHYNSSRTGVRLIGPKPAVGASRWW